MATEEILNRYYNKGKFNHPNRIGYMMGMIRNLEPLTEEEWRMWYLHNVHDEAFLDGLAEEMSRSIPEEYGVSKAECRSYIYDVMFRRTFSGYDKEKRALALLRKMISPNVREAPEEWDTKYFIDFYVYGAKGKLIGIQLKPETFYLGDYEKKVDIKGKMDAFCQEYGAQAYVLTYQSGLGPGQFLLTDPEVLETIKGEL